VQDTNASAAGQQVRPAGHRDLVAAMDRAFARISPVIRAARSPTARSGFRSISANHYIANANADGFMRASSFKVCRALHNGSR